MTSASLANLPSPSKPPRRRRGLFDFVLLLCLGYAVYARTPIGAVVETGIRVARGQKDHPSWLQTFRGRDATTSSTAQTTQALADLGDFARRGLPARLQAAAAAHGVDVDTLAALVAVRGRCDDARCEASAPERLAMFAPGKSGTVDVDDLARGLKAARTELSTDDDALALEALFLGVAPLELAIAAARRSGLDAPADVEAHAPFLSPAARRGPLQGALAVLLVHRLRTLAWPADARFRITSPFGERIHPVTGKTSFHNGTDIGTPTGTPLVAAHHGTVKRQSVDSVSGTYLVLDHGLGVQTTYCHLSATAVRERERIRRRQVVGEAGATGRVTGPHLHYILRIADKAVDPERYGEAPRADGALVAPPAPSPSSSSSPKKLPAKKPPPSSPVSPTASPAPAAPPASPTASPAPAALPAPPGPPGEPSNPPQGPPPPPSGSG